MNYTADIIASNRERVNQAYNSAVVINRNLYKKQDEKATSEYIFENQIIDANNIVREFKENNRRVISITKKTKVGMDGLMIEVAKLMTTHNDDTFIVNFENVRIITGMSNAGWEKDMKDKSPECFKDKIFHHGQLRKADLNDLQNALIIIDEIDTGDKEFQVLHNTLKDAGVLNVTHMEKNNNRFMFASATMIKELYDLYRWGELHYLFNMTIPPNYMGHCEFLKKGIIKEFYSLYTDEKAEEWIQCDIIDNYGIDYRVHIVRVNNKSVTIVQNACIRKGIIFRNHTSTDKLTPDEIKELFKEPLKGHIVLGVKGFFRRANLIPNKWKLRIGATHELHTKVVDNNVQIQGLSGRMTGYWKDIIEGGHKTGPHRTSIKAVNEYEKTFNDPFGLNSYQTSGFKKNKGIVRAESTMISVKNIIGIVAIDLPVYNNNEFQRGYQVFDTQEENEAYAKNYGAQIISKYKLNDKGFKQCSTTTHKVHSLEEIMKFTTTSNKGSNMDKKLSDLKVGDHAYRRYVCYKNTNDISSECYVTIWVTRLKETTSQA